MKGEWEVCPETTGLMRGITGDAAKSQGHDQRMGCWGMGVARAELLKEESRAGLFTLSPGNVCQIEWGGGRAGALRKSSSFCRYQVSHLGPGGYRPPMWPQKVHLCGEGLYECMRE